MKWKLQFVLDGGKNPASSVIAGQQFHKTLSFDLLLIKMFTKLFFCLWISSHMHEEQHSIISPLVSSYSLFSPGELI